MNRFLDGISRYLGISYERRNSPSTEEPVWAFFEEAKLWVFVGKGQLPGDRFEEGNIVFYPAKLTAAPRRDVHEALLKIVAKFISRCTGEKYNYDRIRNYDSNRPLRYCKEGHYDHFSGDYTVYRKSYSTCDDGILFQMTKGRIWEQILNLKKTLEDRKRGGYISPQISVGKIDQHDEYDRPFFEVEENPEEETEEFSEDEESEEEQEDSPYQDLRENIENQKKVRKEMKEIRERITALETLLSEKEQRKEFLSLREKSILDYLKRG